MRGLTPKSHLLARGLVSAADVTVPGADPWENLFNAVWVQAVHDLACARRAGTVTRNLNTVEGKAGAKKKKRRSCRWARDLEPKSAVVAVRILAKHLGGRYLQLLAKELGVGVNALRADAEGIATTGGEAIDKFDGCDSIVDERGRES